MSLVIISRHLLGENAGLARWLLDLQEAGVATDHASYLLPPGTADIFFPTDFQMLDRMYSSVAKARGEEAGVCHPVSPIQLTILLMYH